MPITNETTWVKHMEQTLSVAKFNIRFLLNLVYIGFLFIFSFAIICELFKHSKIELLHAFKFNLIIHINDTGIPRIKAHKNKIADGPLIRFSIIYRPIGFYLVPNKNQHHSSNWKVLVPLVKKSSQMLMKVKMNLNGVRI